MEVNPLYYALACIIAALVSAGVLYVLISALDVLINLRRSRKMGITTHILEYYAGYSGVFLALITLATLLYYWNKP